MDKENKAIRKDEYQKAFSAYSQAMKVFHKREYEKAVEALMAFKEKHASEKELVDRAHMYLAICKGQLKKEKIQLKTFDDYYQYGVYRINQGNYEEALKLLEKAHEMEPKEGKIVYLMASTYSLTGQEEKCFEYLKKAIQIDKFFKILAQNEGDFESLRENKKFKLITRMT